MTPGQIVGAAIGAILGLVLVIIAAVVILAFCVTKSFSSTAIFRLHELTCGLDCPRPNKPHQKDCETEVGFEPSGPLSEISNLAMKSAPEEGVESDLGITPTWAPSETVTESISGRLFPSLLFLKSQASANSNHEIPSSSEYDSFSRTLWVQKLLEKSSPGETVIYKARDPYSSNVISVGGIVVAVRPFHGKNRHEFSSLHTGDLLRIFKFFVKEDSPAVEKSLHIHPSKETKDDNGVGEPDSSAPALEFVDSDSFSYPNLYCTGLVLSTYLEYNVASGNMSLRMRDNSPEELEMVGDFPLSVVSLETTVLKSVGPVEGSTGFGDFA